ncbi:single-stranded DNA-binding protein [Pseudoxanthomonas sp. SGD-10]|nr:single-stranded DNA-binding protein [Pseudoxanthomonas sp. SGD-10]
MSRGYQRITVVGHLGDDPVVKATQGGGLVAEIRIAVTDTYRDRAGNAVEHTEWLRAKLFGRNAEIAQRYLARGRLACIEGRIRTEKWQAADGSDRYSQWIYVEPNGLTLLGSREHARTGRDHQGRAGAGGEGASASPSSPDDDLPF